jgi:hypothetical protein
MNRLPFDPYDFFGDLASGLVLLVGMDLVLGFPRVLGADLKPLQTFMLVLAAYVAGQINATPAKALLEDCLVARFLGRPARNLLRLQKPVPVGWIFPGFYAALPAHIRTRVTTRAKAEGLQARRTIRRLFSFTCASDLSCAPMRR